MRSKLQDWAVVLSVLTLMMFSYAIVTTAAKKAHIHDTEVRALKDYIIYLIETQEIKNDN